jgi:capsular exopolysaccharide synthesis family protein
MSDKELIKVSSREEGTFLRPVSLAEMATPGGYHDYSLRKPDAEELGAQLREWWRRVWRHKLMIALITVIVTSIVTVEAFRDKSIYSATATVEIEKENRTLFRSGAVEIETEDSDYGYQTNRAMKSKIRLLQTRPLLEDVAVILRLDQNAEFMAVTERKDVFEALQSLGASISLRRQKKAAPAVAEIPDVQLSDNLIRSTEESTRLAPVVDVLQSGLAAEPIEDTRMLAISFRHSKPELAAAIANTIAKVFIERSYRGKTAKFETANSWLSTKTRELQAKVEQAEQNLTDYTNQRNIFSTDGKENLVTEKLATLHAQATQAETKRLLSQSLYEEVSKGNVDKLPEAFADPQTIALQGKLNELTTQMAQMRVKLGPEHPEIVKLNRQITTIQKQVEESRAKLADRIKADYERTTREAQSLQAALNQARNEAAQQNENTIKFSILKQEVETAKQLYTDFLQKTNQANLQAASQQSQDKGIQLLEPALVPFSPVGPQRLQTIMIGILLSLAAGIGLALFLEFLNNTIKSVEDAASYLGLPALAIVPALNKKQMQMEESTALTSASPGLLNSIALVSRLMVNNRHSAFAEAYRSIRTSILLSSAGTPPRTILVTSSQPGEGKTTTAINTAIALSQLKARTLIIDADMRRPSMHKIFGITNSQGLSTYLSSNEVELGTLIQKLPLPDLYLLPCGLIPPDPAELVSSGKMKELLEILALDFQYIIIDSPPLINVSDPVVLSTLAEGVIFVVKGGDTKRSIVRRARQELAAVRARVIGVVINNLNLKTEGYDDYYYQRYHSDYKQEQVELSGK